MATINKLIVIRDGNVAGALVDLKKWSIRTGFLKELKIKSRGYMKPSERRRLKHREAVKKVWKQRSRQAAWEARYEELGSR